MYLSLFILLNCAESNSKEKEILKDENIEILPFQIVLKGVLRELKEVQNSTPPITLSINKDSITITVGINENYNVIYNETEFTKILEYFRIDDFKSSNHYYNPYLPYGGSIELKKIIDGKLYQKKITNFKRRDIEINYLDLDSIEIYKTYHLSRIANEISIPLLKDAIIKSEMITAKSMKEALMNPEIVYKLTLRNTRTKYLSPNIRKLKNLRVLDISGSFIKSIPPEIEECIHLKSIIANASQLSEIPSSIGNLKRIRVINFGYCKIKSIPPEMGNLNSLWSLSLGSNQLTNLPEPISKLKNLTFFSVAHNRFTEFPKAVLGLGSVGNLWMHGNEFNEIPAEIINLGNLHSFLLSVDKIENIEAIKEIIPNIRIIDEK